MAIGSFMSQPQQPRTPSTTVTREAFQPAPTTKSGMSNAQAQMGGMERSGSGGMQPLNQKMSTQGNATSGAWNPTNFNFPQQNNHQPGTAKTNYGQPSTANMSTQVTPTQGSAPQWNLPAFNPTPYQPPKAPPPNPAGQGGVLQNFFQGGGQNFFSPEAFNANDNPYAKYIAAMLPVMQAGQNAYQWASELDAGNQHWYAQHGLDVNNSQFQQQLSTQQQLAAEQQAAIAAGQFQQQFGHTKEMDYANLGLSQQQIDNALAIGMGQNQASIDVANIYGNSNINQAHIGANASMYGADQQLAGAYAYADAQKHQANMGVNEAHIGAAAQNYGADQQLAGAYAYADAQKYGSQLGLQGQMGSAGLYSDAQRYQSDQELAAAKYQWDMQMAMNQAMMANNLQVANTQAYGRSQAPNAAWARSWS